MTYCKNYCEEKGISTSKLNEAQRTLYYIAENMKMEKSISEEGYKHFQMALKALEQEQKIIETIDFAINASDGDTDYFVGLRNGMRYTLSLIDRKEPQFERCVEPCKDAVSRKAVVELITMQMIYSGKFDGTKIAAVKELLEDINNIPLSTPIQTDGDLISTLQSVAPTRNRAKWIMTGEKEELYCEIARCSSCGGETINNGVDKFCPNCGAKMQEVEE